MVPRRCIGSALRLGQLNYVRSNPGLYWIECPQNTLGALPQRLVVLTEIRESAVRRAIPREQLSIGSPVVRVRTARCHKVERTIRPNQGHRSELERFARRSHAIELWYQLRHRPGPFLPLEYLDV